MRGGPLFCLSSVNALIIQPMIKLWEYPSKANLITVSRAVYSRRLLRRLRG